MGYRVKDYGTSPLLGQGWGISGGWVRETGFLKPKPKRNTFNEHRAWQSPFQSLLNSHSLNEAERIPHCGPRFFPQTPQVLCRSTQSVSCLTSSADSSDAWDASKLPTDWGLGKPSPSPKWGLSYTSRDKKENWLWWVEFLFLKHIWESTVRKGKVGLGKHETEAVILHAELPSLPCLRPQQHHTL